MCKVSEYYTDYTIDHVIVLLVLQLARKKLGIATKVKLPISPAILSMLRRHMDLQVPKSVALW